ncbi:MAG TPA: hypothetical protein VL443_15195 [Cyclobacteriaceae bacterium]|jgi:hypothetical protein|nr:hypothetical protein [Cyclobacteriaceae bacterium]
MEIDELKEIWKNGDGFRPKGEAEIATMLKGSSKSIISKLKRSVWFEMIFTLVSGVVLLTYALTLESGALKWTSLSILVLFVGYSFYYIKKLLLLNRFNSSGENIKANLESLVKSLSGYLKFYKRSYTILYPIYFVLSLLFIAIEQGATEFINNLKKPATLLYLLILSAVFYFCCTWLIDWLLKKLYGNQLEKLKTLLKDLEMPLTSNDDKISA